MVIEDENLLTTEEKEYIENTVLSGDTPFWWIKESVIGEGKPIFVHILIHRESQQILSAEYAAFFQKLAQRFATRYKIPCNVFLRGSLNLTYPQSGRSAVHVDHNFPHYQFLLHLNKADGGSTLILDSKGQVIKTISPKQFKGFGFKGGLPHCMTFPNTGRRVVAVLTFL